MASWDWMGRGWLARGATGALAVASLTTACGNVVVEYTSGGGTGTTGAGNGGTGGTVSTTPTTGMGGVGGTTTDFPGGASTGGQGDCVPDVPEADVDGDGWTVLEGDCDDCDPDINPGALEVISEPKDPGDPIPEPKDEDCNGVIDDVPPLCDDNLAFDSQDPYDAARALDLCQFVKEGSFHGVVSAEWKLPDGADPPGNVLPSFHVGHGLLPDFGPNSKAQKGSRLLALSSGTARRPIDMGYAGMADKAYGSQHPPFMPFESPACPGAMTGSAFDGAALQVVLQPPSNVAGFRYHLRFYTRGWPNDVCTSFNDQAAVLMDPPPPGVPTGNIAYDEIWNPLTVSFITPKACWCGQPCADFPECSAEAAQLDGSGFNEFFGAATGWIDIPAPVMDVTQQFSLRFLIYDAGDGIIDSTILFDAFSWVTYKPMPI